jgi:hypothetical protein
VGGGLDLVLRDHRAGIPADDLRRDVEARELLDDDVLGAAVNGLVARRVDALDRRVQKVDGRQRVLDLLAPLPDPGVRAGANVADVGIGDDTGAGPSSPNRPVWPGTSAAPPGTRPPRTRPPDRTPACPVVGSAPLPAPAPLPLAAD